MRGALRVLAYPAMTGGAVLFCALALAHAWPVWAIGAVVFTASAVLVAGLERVIPYSAAWSRHRGDERTDVLHFLVSNRAFDVGSFAAIIAFAPLGRWARAHMDIGLWPHAWPMAAQALLVLVLIELPWYSMHRMEHTSAWLFRIHAAHHSSTRMYWLNLNRNHPLDNLVSAVVSMAPLAFLGVSEAPLAYVAAFSGAHAMLQHANIDLRTGPLDYVFTTARVHRFHHSRDPQESMANYGARITLWDFVFGTRRFYPDAIPPEDVGLYANERAYPEDFVGQLVAPFDHSLLDDRSAR